MASIGEVYGNDFQQRAVHDKAAHVAKLYASNIVHKQFSVRNEGQSMWDGNNMKPDIISALEAQVQGNNAKFRLKHISKTSDDINMIPYLINGAVEYFVVVDMSGEHTQLYTVYITPNLMEAF
jgi:hypothetical protein